MDQKQKFLKAKLNNITKILSLTNSFTEFLQSLEKSFQISLIPLELSNFSLIYLDEEQDNIQIENSYDFSEALKFMQISQVNTIKLLILPKISFSIKKDNKDNFEYIETNSAKSFDYQASPQIEFHLPRGDKKDLIKIQKLEDIKFFCDEELYNYHNNKKIKRGNFNQEEVILSKSPEISLDLPKSIFLKKNNFEITYEKLNNLKKTEKTEKNQEEKNQSKFMKKKAKEIIKDVFSEELKKLKYGVSSELNNMLVKYSTEIQEKNFEASKKIKELFFNLSAGKNNLKSHKGFTCRSCKQSPIFGIRYKCSVCMHFDLCEKCEEKSSHSHSHPFIKIRAPELNPAFIQTITNDENDYENNDFNNQENVNIPPNQYFQEEFYDFDMNNEGNLYNNYNLSRNSYKNYNFSNENLKKNDELKKPTKDKFQIICLNNLFDAIEIRNCNAREFSINLKIKNIGKICIPSRSYFTCIESKSEIKGNSVPINKIFKQNEILNLEINLNIKDSKKGDYISVWRMQSAQREFFGEEIVLRINILKNDDIKINQNFVQETKNENKLFLEYRNNPIKVEVEKKNAGGKIISLEDFKKLRMKRNNSISLTNSIIIEEEKKPKEIKPVDFYGLADEIIKNNPGKNIARKELINALFRTGGHEENSIRMATNETLNHCRYYQKNIFS